MSEHERADHAGPDRPADPRAAARIALTIDGRAVTVPEGTTILAACAPSATIPDALLSSRRCSRSTSAASASSRSRARACWCRPARARSRPAWSCTPTPSGSGTAASWCSSCSRRRSTCRPRRSPAVPRALRREPERYGPPAPPDRRPRRACARATTTRRTAPTAATVRAAGQDRQRPLRPRLRQVHPLLQVRRGVRRPMHQNTFAIAVAGRGFDARISTEFAVPLPDSACVYCGNCIAVCPTGALMFESRARAARGGQLGRVAADARPTRSARTAASAARSRCTCRTTRSSRSTSPLDHTITHGNLCIKGRFGFQHVQAQPADTRSEPE